MTACDCTASREYRAILLCKGHTGHVVRGRPVLKALLG